MKNRFLLYFLCIVSFAVGQPHSKLGGLPGSPMRLGFGAEGIGMGNALVALRFNPMTGYYNPALLPFQENPVVSASTGFLSLDRNLNFFTFGKPVHPSGGISVSIINSGVSDIENRDSDGRRIGTLSTSENAFLLSFGVRLDDRLSVGISTKILYYHLYSSLNSTTVGFDLGALVLLSDEWSVGASLQDLGSKYKWDTTILYGTGGNTTIDRFPLRKKIGIAYVPSGFSLQASVETEHVAGMLLQRMGAAYSIVDGFILRAGIDQVSFTDNVLPKPSFGFTAAQGIGSMTAFLSYSLVVEPYSPASFHLLTVGATFK